MKTLSQAETEYTGYNEQGNFVLPNAQWLNDSDFIQDGANLVLKQPDGRTLEVEGYFTQDPRPELTLFDEHVSLSGEFLKSFIIAGNTTANAGKNYEQSEIGYIDNLHGGAVIIRADGEEIVVNAGTGLYEGDIIKTDDASSLKIQFMDGTIFSLSENASMAMDRMVYDPETQEGETLFSILKGGFLFLSGNIAKSNPENMIVETPMATIEVRGTIVAGSVGLDEGFNFTLVDGAILVNSDALEPQILTEAFTAFNGAFDVSGKLFSNMEIVTPGTMLRNYQENFNILSASDVSTIENAVRESAAENGETIELDLLQVMTTLNDSAVSNQDISELNRLVETFDNRFVETFDSVHDLATNDFPSYSTFGPEATLTPPVLPELKTKTKTNDDKKRIIETEADEVEVEGEGGDNSQEELAYVTLGSETIIVDGISYLPASETDASIGTFNYLNINFTTYNFSALGIGMVIQDTAVSEFIQTGDQDDIIYSINMDETGNSLGDYIESSKGNDKIYVASGENNGTGVEGKDDERTAVISRAGNDEIYVLDNAAIKYIQTDEGNDIVNITESANSSIIFGNYDDYDLINLGEGEDRLNITLGADSVEGTLFDGDEKIKAGTGHDTLHLIGNTLINGAIASHDLAKFDEFETVLLETGKSAEIDNQVKLGFSNGDMTSLNAKISMSNEEIILRSTENGELASIEIGDQITDSNLTIGFDDKDSGIKVTDNFSIADDSELTLDLTNLGDFNDMTRLLSLHQASTKLDGILTINVSSEMINAGGSSNLIKNNNNDNFDEIYFNYIDADGNEVDMLKSEHVFIPLYDGSGLQIAAMDVNGANVQIGGDLTLNETGNSYAVLVGADNEDNTLTLQSGGLSYFVGGEGGNDTLALEKDYLFTSTSSTSSLGVIQDFTVSQIETLDLSKLNEDQLKSVLASLSADNVEAMIEDTNEVTGEDNNLIIKIDGNVSADALNELSDWTQDTSTLLASGYSVYTATDTHGAEISLHIMAA